MSTKSVSASQDERHFIGDFPKSRVLQNKKYFLWRIRMAKFHKVHWSNADIQAIPMGFRRHLRFYGRTFPYVSGDKIKFLVKIKTENGLRLNQLVIWERFTNHFGENHCREVKTLAGYPDNAKVGRLFDEAYITSKHAEYWLGVPDGADSHLLVEADLLGTAEFYTKWILPAFAAFLGYWLDFMIETIKKFLIAIK